MEKYYPELNREYFSVNPSLNKRSMLEVKCLKCEAIWQVKKEEALKKSGVLQLLNHEYGHRNKENKNI